MLRSNDFNSVVDDFPPLTSSLDVEPISSTTASLPAISNNITPITDLEELQTSIVSNKCDTNNAETSTISVSEPASLAVKQLTAGFLQFYSPPIVNAKEQLKELIQKQNKIYIDLSAEKFKLDNAEIMKINEMMISVKVYREKLLKIKKQMQSIYQRTKILKKRAINIQTCKEKELQRKLHKLQQEESLIAKQPR